MWGHESAYNGAYDMVNENDLFETYKRAEKYLSIKKEPSKELENIEELRKELEKRNGEVKELREEMEAMKAREAEKEPYDKGFTTFIETIESKPEMKKAIVKMMASDPDMKNVMREILKELMEKEG
jgi:RNA recognition motif-containing protein